MPDDSNRFDLKSDLSGAKSAFLNDVEVAAEQVKHQLKAAEENEKKKAQAARQKKISAGVIALSAVVIMVVAYFVVFAKPNSDMAKTANQTATYPKVRIVSPVPIPQKTAAPATTSAAPGRRSPDSQVVEHPSDEYEQPGSGM